MSLPHVTKRRLITAALVGPASIWLFVFLVLPFIAIIVFAFGERAPEGGYQAAFTFEQFANLGARSAAFVNTLILAPIGAAACLIVAYPVAYFLAVKANPQRRLLLVSLIVVPFWTSLLVRTYAWMYLLGAREELVVADRVQDRALRVGQHDHAFGVDDLLEQHLHHRRGVRQQALVSLARHDEVAADHRLEVGPFDPRQAERRAAQVRLLDELGARRGVGGGGRRPPSRDGKGAEGC